MRLAAPVAGAFRKVRRHIRFMLLFCGAVFAAGSYLQEPAAVHRPADLPVPAGFSAPANSFRPSTPAIGVYDGDTIRIGSERIRLLGFDTPELGHNSRCAREARDAIRARDFLKAEIARGGDIRVQRSGTDRYGRTLAQLYIDGTDVSDTMIGRGLGRSYSGGQRDGWC
ncbi:MAG: thermonuclease family protein [Parvibaculum sp.]|nr:thermonuclease family protein [Parvibaculum sp.]